jgi:hypothetical protein
MLVQPNGLMVIVLEHILPIDIPWYSHLLVGGAIAVLKNMKTRQWVWDDIPYMKWKIKHV